MTAQKVLVVEDSKETVRAIRVYLEQSGYEVLAAYDGDTGLHIIRREIPELIILDLMLPDRNGLDIARIIRQDNSLRHIPIIMLTARVEDMDKILGLELGADDYMTKPFNPRELVARVRSVLRRSQGELETDNEPIFRFNGLSLDPSRRRLTYDEKVIDLTRIEFDLLKVLISSAGHVFTRSELIESALDYDYEGMERSLDTHIKNLRRKIEPDPKKPQFIQTVYGVGYRLGER